MIDRDVFEEWIVRFAEFYPGDTPDGIIAIYWKQLKGSMTTEQFEDACVRILGTRERKEGFPPWGAFLSDDKDTEEEALEQWEVVRQAMKNSRAGLPDEATEQTRRLVAKEGGLRRLGQMQLDDVQFVEQRFKRDYGTLSGNGRDALPPMSDEGRELVSDAMDGKLNP